MQLNQGRRQRMFLLAASFYVTLLTGCSTSIHRVDIDIDKPTFLTELTEVCEKCALSVDLIASMEYRYCNRPYTKERMVNIGLGHPMYQFMIDTITPLNQERFIQTAKEFFSCRSGEWVQYTYEARVLQSKFDKLIKQDQP